MAAFSKWKCERCGFTGETSGPHEFYRDDHGELRPYGHPHAVSIEAKEKEGAKVSMYRGIVQNVTRSKSR